MTGSFPLWFLQMPRLHFQFHSPSPFVFLFLFPLICSFVEAHVCSEKPETFRSQCPPFSSPPIFPFSSSPGCGHPSFQVKCSSPHSVISINDLSFSLLDFNVTSSTLLLSPHSLKTSTSCTTSNFLSIPDRAVNLSGSPFRIPDRYCSRLSHLRPCSPPALPNCSHCQWDCKLIKNPVHLLRDCGSAHNPISEQGCRGDVLEFLDNMLRFGIEMVWEEAQDQYFSECRDCQQKNGICGFNSSDPNKQFLCYLSKSRLSPPWIRRDNSKMIGILSSIFVFLCLFLVVFVVASIFRYRWWKSVGEEDPSADFLHNYRSANPLPPVFTYEELEYSTNRFDSKRKIGDGGFGSVYLGQIADGRIVAVKYLHKHQPTSGCGEAFSTKSFCNEILILSSINHPNLVKLHGYCSDRRGLILVYDYVPNGTLADHLHRKKTLSWPVRIDIAWQIALAMEYLHFSVVPPVVHRDITTANIFVEKDMRIKIGDFGLSRLLILPDSSSSSSSAGYVWTGPQGTPGYLDPDYHSSFRLTEKSDVYSFGVVLMELITGLRAVDQLREKREITLADLMVIKIQTGQLHQVVDSNLSVDLEVLEGVDAVAELAFRCVADDKDDRPDAREVARELKRIWNRTRRVGDDVAKG